MGISGKELAKLFKKRGFKEVKGGGKGSHIKMRKGIQNCNYPLSQRAKEGVRESSYQATRGGGDMKYHFKIHKEGKGFWAECLEIPECVTQGDSKEELFDNMEDAINTYLEEPEDSKFLAPLPKRFIKKNQVYRKSFC